MRSSGRAGSPPASAPSLLSVVNWFPTPSETFVVRKLEGLAHAGFDVSVAAALFFHPAADDAGFGLVPTAPWRYPRSSWAAVGPGGALGAGRAQVAAQIARGHGGGAISAKRRALRAPLASARADIIHFEFSGIAVAYQDLLASLRPARLAVSCRGGNEQILPFTDPARARELEAVFAEMDLIHCVSDAMRRTVESLGAPAEKILVNRPAIPVADFAPLSIGRVAHEGPLRVVSVGRLHWVKGYDDALRAIADLVAAGHQVDYRIAGEGDQRDKLSYLIHHLGLAGSVTLLGSQSQSEIKGLLTWADAYVLSSLSEGISNAVLEAMAAGLPVVATDCGGMGEVIDSGVDGFTVGIGDHRSMRECLEHLAVDRDLGCRIGAAAAARARAEFDIARQVHAFVQAYEALLAR